MRPSTGTERPLPPRERALLQLRAGAMILAFYAAAILSMLLLGVLLALGTVALAGAARVGATAYVGRIVRPVLDLLQILFRQLWLRQGTQYRITLDESEAPRLFRAVAALARRLEVTPPRIVVLEMTAGAWVQLKGFRRRSGNVTLGVGYDLLAGLTERETEAVLAHELGHMRFVQRGFSRWLNKGLARLGGVSQTLEAYASARRAEGQRSHLADWSASGFRYLVQHAARLVATCSRQDEFEADRAAATISGSDALRMALRKLEALHEVVGLIPWPERVARLQAGGGYADWLVEELARRMVIPDPAELPSHSLDHYSTHPSLRDRILNLPDEAPGPTSGPGIRLLAAPDQAGSRLAEEIQRVSAVQERKDTRQVRRAALKGRGSGNLWHLAGAGMLIVGMAGLLFAVTDPTTPVGDTLAWLTLLVAGGVVVRLGFHRDRRELPVPVYGTMTTWKPFESTEALQAEEKRVEGELRGKAGNGSSRQKAEALTVEAYEALRRRDYLRAHVAARLALGERPRSVEPSLAYAVAAGGIGNRQQTFQKVAQIRARWGLRTRSTRWGAAWALSMIEDAGAEGPLLLLVEREAGNATFTALLALIQLRRGKVQSAVENAKKALALEPDNDAIAELLVSVLLSAGRVREAEAASARLERLAATQAHTAFALVRVRLMARDPGAAAAWAERVYGVEEDGKWCIALGHAFSEAREFEIAASHYTRAVTTPYAPQGHLSLGGIAMIHGDRPKAREHCIASLAIAKAQFAMGENASSHFHQAIARLNALAERRQTCSAWIATILAGNQLPLAGCALLIYAPTEAEARASLEEITDAMRTPEDGFNPGQVEWRVAPPERQAVRPVFPGVQGVLT